MTTEPVRVFRPVTHTEVAQVRAAMAGLGIPFFIENENFFSTGGGMLAAGDSHVWVVVPAEHAELATDALRSWFDQEAS